MHLFVISLSVPLLLLHALEDMFERSLHQTSLFELLGVRLSVLDRDYSIFAVLSQSNRALNSEGLSSSCLAISEDSSIVACETAVSNGLGHVIKDLSLGYLFASYVVEGVGFDILARSLKSQLFLVLNRHTRLGIVTSRIYKLVLLLKI